MLNHIEIMGRLTRDPELRTTENGTLVVSFSIAVERDYSTDGERKVDFVDCAAWRQTAEFISKYFFKGSMILISGRLQSRKWQARDGSNRTAWEVIAEKVYFADSRRNTENTEGASAETSVSTKSVFSPPFSELFDDDDGELPF